MKRYLLTATLALGALTACGNPYGYGHPYGAYYAPVAPPAVRAEYYGPAPSREHVWINGYWGYSGNRYEWNAGRWERPPHRGARWVEGRWDHDGRGYRYRKGYWK